MSVASWCCKSFCVVPCVSFLYGPCCHGTLKHNIISTLFTTSFVWTSLQFILQKKFTVGKAEIFYQLICIQSPCVLIASLHIPIPCQTTVNHNCKISILCECLERDYWSEVFFKYNAVYCYLKDKTRGRQC